VNLLCVEIVRAMGGAEDPRGGCERAGGTCGVKMGAPSSAERGKLTSEEAEGDVPNSMTNTHATAPSLSKPSCCQTPLSSAQGAVIESRMRDCNKQAVLLELRPMS
jgi:hypothetical protein